MSWRMRSRWSLLMPWFLPPAPRGSRSLRCANAEPDASVSARRKVRTFMGARHLTGRLPCKGVASSKFCNNVLPPMPELKTRILVVDDDQRLRDLLVKYLSGEGYEVKAVPDARAMDKQPGRERHDLVGRALMLPGEDGLAICRRLRSQQTSPAIIMLTAKGDDVDRIVGLEMGADDYLPKPFNPRELLARINAVLRRR